MLNRVASGKASISELKDKYVDKDLKIVIGDPSETGWFLDGKHATSEEFMKEYHKQVKKYGFIDLNAAIVD